jgi:hypothetical protein
VGTGLVVGLVLLAYNAWAESGYAPEPAERDATPASLLSYQGYLTDAAGNPLDGYVDIVFRLYDQPEGGASLWTEARTGANAVPLRNGLFELTLGSLTPIPADLYDRGSLYLGVQVGNDPEMTPRELIGAVPMAALAQAVPDSSISSRKLAPSWFRGHNLVPFSTSATTPQDTGVVVTFACETDCTALVLHRGLIAHSEAGGQVRVQIDIDGQTAFTELGVAQFAYDAGTGRGWQQVSGFDFVNLPAGLHTAQVKLRCDRGTCHYHGDPSADAEQLSVLMFSQP